MDDVTRLLGELDIRLLTEHWPDAGEPDPHNVRLGGGWASSQSGRTALQRGTNLASEDRGSRTKAGDGALREVSGDHRPKRSGPQRGRAVRRTSARLSGQGEGDDGSEGHPPGTA